MGDVEVVVLGVDGAEDRVEDFGLTALGASGAGGPSVLTDPDRA